MSPKPHQDLGNDCSRPRSSSSTHAAPPSASTRCSRRRTSPAGRSTSTSAARTVWSRRCSAALRRGPRVVRGRVRRRHGAPGQASRLFDQLDELVSNADFRGCRYFATDLAFADPPSGTRGDRGLPAAPPRASRTGAQGIGAANPEHAAEQLHLLIEGTLVMGATQDGEHPARAARDLAAVVIG